MMSGGFNIKAKSLSCSAICSAHSSLFHLFMMMFFFSFNSTSRQTKFAAATTIKLFAMNLSLSIYFPYVFLVCCKSCFLYALAFRCCLSSFLMLFHAVFTKYAMHIMHSNPRRCRRQASVELMKKKSGTHANARNAHSK